MKSATVRDEEMWSVLGRNLLRAVETGSLDKVDKFIGNGADPDFVSYDGVSPLSLSVSLGYNTITSVLLARGSSVNRVVSDGTERGGTALHVAARRDKPHALRAMLRAGALLDFRDSAGRTACMIAAFRGHTEPVRMLVSAGADVSMCDSVQRTALHWASLQGHAVVVQLLLSWKREDTLNATDWNGETPLVCACREGRYEVVSLLLEAGADVNVSTKPHTTADMLTEYTPLHAAAYGGYQHIVERLLIRGAAVGKKDGTGRSPLHWAAQRGKTSIVELLLQAGSPVNTLNAIGETPIHDAILSKNSRHIVSMLLSCGANPDIKATAGDSALIKALHADNVNTVRFLLQANCNVNQTGGDDKTSPFQIAVTKGNWKLIEMLVFADCDLCVVRKWTKPDRIPSRLLGNKAMVLWLKSLAFAPRTLKVLNRIVIRNILGHSIQKKLSSIEFPEALKCFITLSELESY